MWCIAQHYYFGALDVGHNLALGLCLPRNLDRPTVLTSQCNGLSGLAFNTVEYLFDGVKLTVDSSIYEFSRYPTEALNLLTIGIILAVQLQQQCITQHLVWLATC